MEYNGKKALVCGMARSGIAAAKLLNRLGARVTLQDMKKREEISADVLALEGEGIVLYTGANPDEIACAQDLIVLSPGIPCDRLLLRRRKMQESRLSARWNWRTA